MPIAKGQPQVVQISWGPVGCTRSHDPTANCHWCLASGCVFLSRCGGALVDGFDFPDIFLWACWPQWCLGLGPNMPITKGQPQVVQISWGPVGCTRSHDPTANCHWCLASGCVFLSRCGGALVDGFDFPDIFLWACWPQWCLGLGPNMPIAKGQPQVVQVSLGPWAHCQGSATGGADFMGPSWCPRSHDPQKPIAIGVGQWLWVF